MKHNELIRIACEEGKKVEIPMSFRILLHDIRSIFYLEEGEGDLFILSPTGFLEERDDQFFVEMSEKNNAFLGDLLTGPLHYITHFRKGDFIFPFLLSSEFSSGKVVLKANTSVTLRKVPFPIIDAFCENNPDGFNIFRELSEEWIYRISTKFSHLLPPERQTMLYLQHEEYETESNPVHFAISRHEIGSQGSLIGWVKLIHGTLEFFGFSQYDEPEVLIPVSPDVWFTLEENSKLKYFTEPPVVSPISLYHSTLLYGQVLVRGSKELEKVEIADELDDIKVRYQLNNKKIGDTIKRLGHILSFEKYYQPQFYKNELFQSLDLIANFLDKKIVIPPKLGGMPLNDQVYSICIASKLFQREVNLDDNWWKRGAQPVLLSRIEPSGPVACLPKSDGRYGLIDPLNGFLEKRVEKADVNSFSTKARVFYMGLPNKVKLTIFDILKRFSRSNLKDIGIILLTSSIAMSVGVVMPYLNQVLFDGVIPSSDYNLLFQILTMMFVITIFQNVLGYVKLYSIIRFETVFSHNVDMSIWIKLLNLPFSFFKKFSTGDLFSRINTLSSLRKLVTNHSISLTLDAVFSIVYLVVMFWYSSTLALLTLGMLFLISAIDFFALYKSIGFQRELQRIGGEVYGRAMQVIVGISKVKIYGVESRIFNYWAGALVQTSEIGVKANRLGIWIKTINDVISSFMSFTIMIGMMLLKYYSTPENPYNFSIGEFMAFSAAFGYFSGYYFSVISSFTSYVGIQPSWERCKVILDEPQEVPDTSLLNVELKGKIELSNIYFRFDKDSPYIHSDVSIRAEPGEFIAIVGRSGCGKSTLINLILGFETPERGGVFFDDKESTSFDIQKVRSQFGVVSQNTRVIDGNIKDNITGGKICTDEEIEEAMEKAEFHKVIKELPMGLHTFISHGTETLSGGQLQRLYIARALVSKPKVLILDEATNALDNETQKRVMDNIDKMNVTRIVIAHRLSTVTRADRIYVMREGKIVETGTYHELIAKKGYFARLVDLQAL